MRGWCHAGVHKLSLLSTLKLSASGCARQAFWTMGRVRGLQGVATLLSRASVANGAGRVGVSELAGSCTSHRCLSGEAVCSFHACKTPIADGTLYFLWYTTGSRKAVCNVSATLLVHSGSPIRELWKGVSVANTMWTRHISAEALQPSDTYTSTATTAQFRSICHLAAA